MKAQETFTLSEIVEILNGLGIETFIEPADEEHPGTLILCEYGTVEFMSVLLTEEPFFDQVIFLATQLTEEEPSGFVSEFNQEPHFAIAYVPQNDERFDPDSSGDVASLRLVIPFDGGVTVEHIQAMTSFWMEDLYEFLGLEDAEDKSVELEDFLPFNDEIKEMGIVQQLEWVLGDSISRSARELAGYLMMDKHVINSALYKNKQLFASDGAQPPRWTTIKPNT